MHPLVKGLNPYEESENTLMRAFTTQVEVSTYVLKLYFIFNNNYFSF